MGFDCLVFLSSIEQAFCDCEIQWDHYERACIYACFKRVHSTDMDV